MSACLSRFIEAAESLVPLKEDLVTVFDAILTSRQTCEKLQCLYENLISNNCSKAAVLKIVELLTKASPLRILLTKIEGVPFARRPKTTFFNFLYICL